MSAVIPYDEWELCQCKERRMPPGALEVRYDNSPYVHVREKDGECYRDTRDLRAAPHMPWSKK